MKIPAYLLILILLNGCSAGRYYKKEEQNERSYPRIGQNTHVLIRDIATACEAPNAESGERKANTVFVHPGLLLLNLDWDQSLAVESAKILVKHGYAKSFLQLRDRDATRVGEQMLKDPGTRFMGLHYSMGGQPELLASTLASVAQARKESGKDFVYYPVLVDPFGIKKINTLLDLNAEHLGQMFIVLSKENSFLRPDISGIRDDILRHPKVHLIYAEDIGEVWGHFDALGSIAADDTPSRFRDIFFLIAHTVVDGLAPAEFEERLALLKIKYAIEDSRPVNAAWLKLAYELPCAKNQNQLAAAKGR